MQPQRLSYGTAGTAVQPRADAPVKPRTPPLARVPAALQASPRYVARTPDQVRQRRVVIATMLVAHGVAVIGLLNASRLREDVAEARPVFLAVVDATVTPAPSRPLPPPPSLKVPTPPPLTLPLIAAEPSPSTSPLVVVAVAPPPAPVAASAEPAPPAPAAPRLLPATAVQFLVPPAPVYSRISAKMRESGQVLVRVFIDEAGLPRNVQLVRSTGFARLDDSALTAVRNARFKPYLDNGVAVAGWASIPIEFELPR